MLKEQGMTIKGVKKILKNKEPLKLDENINRSIKASDLKRKLLKISGILKDLKKIVIWQKKHMLKLDWFGVKTR